MSKRSIKIVVTGASGQLGQCLKSISTNWNYAITFLDKQNLDITSVEQVYDVLTTIQPDIIINTAAYTQVDLAEEESDRAHQINAEAVNTITMFCKENETKLIHISTDYVFDGEGLEPYTEEQETNPKTVYGASKLAGENSILDSNLAAFWIIRTSWLYSNYGKNFYKTILDLAAKNANLSVVNDQWGSPTRAEELADFILRYIPQLTSETRGIYHFSNSGSCTWFDFAKAILNKHNSQTEITAVKSSEFPTKARRPSYSVLDNSKITKVFKYKFKNWLDALG